MIIDAIHLEPIYTDTGITVTGSTPVLEVRYSTERLGEFVIPLDAAAAEDLGARLAAFVAWVRFREQAEDL